MQGRIFIVACQLLSAEAFTALAASRPTFMMRSPPAVAVIERAPPAGFEWGMQVDFEAEECMLDAENAAEQAACLGKDAAVASAGTGSTAPVDGAATANSRDMLMGYNSKDLGECLIDAENAAEG